MSRHEMRLARELAAFCLSSRRKRVKDAEEKIKALEGLSEQKRKELLKRFSKDNKKYLCNFTEWYKSFKFHKISNTEKKAFLTRDEMAVICKRYEIDYPEQRQVTRNKDRFLKKYGSFIHRKWLYATEDIKPEEIDRFVMEHDTIVKPRDGSLGSGIIKIPKGTENASEIVFQKQFPIVLEECVVNVDELAEFHPASLNTVRVTTISNGKDVRILGAELRVGNHGKICDNAAAGGVLASIDIDSGMINSHGFDKMGEEMTEHPESGKAFLGVQIPMWEDVIKTCKAAALFDKNTRLIGWDIAVTLNGIEVIEANSLPSPEGFQLTTQRGIRERFISILKELHLPYRDVLIWEWLIKKMMPVICLLGRKRVSNT